MIPVTQIPFRRVPFVPSSMEAVYSMVELADLSPGVKTVDLGSGDGRVLLEFARKGAEAHGYEIDLDLVTKTEEKIIREELDKNAFVHLRNYWEEDLSTYEIVTVYGMYSVMEDLEKKLSKELNPGSKVISNVFEFPDWKPERQMRNVFLYIK